MSVLSTLASWTRKRKRLLAGLVGCAVQGISVCVPGVGLAAELLGTLANNAAEDLLDPETKQPLSRDQVEQIEGWVRGLTKSYSGLLDRLEQLNVPDAGTVADLSRTLAQTLGAHRELLDAFDRCAALVREQTLSLGIIERKLDEQFHVQQRMAAGLEEIKAMFIRSPLLEEWTQLRRARPEAVQAVAEADEHFLAGRKEQGIAVLLGLLRQRGVGEATLAHHVGLLELSRGRVSEAREQLRRATRVTSEGASGPPAALGGTVARLATLSGRSDGSGWRSLPRGFRLGGKYLVMEEVGRGGMASVYRAENVVGFGQDREVALKVPSPDLMRDEQTRLRFEQEIEVSLRLSSVEHSHIVKVLDHETFNDPFTGQKLSALVMEFVSGVNLGRWLARRSASGRPIGLDEVRTVMLGVCAALEHAHEMGVFHRDLKPQNVMVAKGSVVKLMDFGIARVLEEGRESLTRLGQVVGTPTYMPPELLGMNPVVDARTDVYLAGNLLLELLTGDPAGDAESRDDSPAAWVELIADSMNRVRSKRPAGMAAFRERLLEEAPAPVPTPAPTPASRPASHSPPPQPSPPTTVDVPQRASELPQGMVNSIEMKLVRIPAGKFLMGSPNDESARSHHEHQHEVEITRAFWLGSHPVTVGQFRVFVQASGSRIKRGWEHPGFPQDDRHPVVCVSWNDAQAFCAWLSSSKNPWFYRPGWLCRLPTEAEWEYACRGGARSYQTFHFGNRLSSTQANFDGECPYGGAYKGPSLRKTTPVGSYLANAWGLYDLHGNVSEWCADWFDNDYYLHSPAEDPPGASEGSFRVVRGGNWDRHGRECRSAFRGWVAPSSQYHDLGFRVALVPSEDK
jgi:formylglycine-generating enzyme required for sulfatase activity